MFIFAELTIYYGFAAHATHKSGAYAGQSKYFKNDDHVVYCAGVAKHACKCRLHGFCCLVSLSQLMAAECPAAFSWLTPAAALADVNSCFKLSRQALLSDYAASIEV